MAAIRAYRLIVQIVSTVIIYGTLIGLAATELILPILVPYPQYATVVSALDVFQILITSGSFPRVPLAVILGTSIIFGRAFCGWICPVGFIQDVFVPIARRRGLKIQKEQNRGLYHFGLFLLSIFLIFIASIGAEVAAGVKSLEDLSWFIRAPYSTLDPVNTAISIALKASFWENRTSYTKVAILRIFVFALFVYLLVRVPRGRCRRFCPLGLMMSLVSKHALLTVKIDPIRCTKCNACVRACPMGIDLLDYKYEVRDPMCILCLDCADACPEGAIKVAISRCFWINSSKFFMSFRKLISLVTIPFTAPTILFFHAARLDGNVLMSVPAIILAAIIPVVGIALYSKHKGTGREMKQELRARRAFMIPIGLAIIALGMIYKRLQLETLAYAAITYGLGTLIAGILTLLGHKTSVHAMGRSVSGFIELHIRPLLGALMILVSILAAISRVITRAHTRSQVLTGFLIGPVSLAIVMALR